MPKPGPCCKYCGSNNVVRSGKRETAAGPKQVFLCKACLRKFSNLNRSTKHTDPAVILKTLTLYCQGYTYEQILFYLRRKHRISLSKSAISKWMKEYHPDYLEIRHLNDRYPRVLESHLFRHERINYNFQVHLPKLYLCPFKDLRSYLLNLPRFIKPSHLKGTKRCSQLCIPAGARVRRSANTRLNMVALNALQPASSNRKRGQAGSGSGDHATDTICHRAVVSCEDSTKQNAVRVVRRGRLFRPQPETPWVAPPSPVQTGADTTAR